MPCLRVFEQGIVVFFKVFRVQLSLKSLRSINAASFEDLSQLPAELDRRDSNGFSAKLEFCRAHTPFECMHCTTFAHYVDPSVMSIAYNKLEHA